MEQKYRYGDSVRLTRNVRNDGTYPGKEIGDLLVTRGAVGYVQDVGTYLQDQIIYKVMFMEENMVVGCREEELIGGDEPWNPSAFMFRDKVTTCRILTVNNEVIANPGDEAEVIKVLELEEEGAEYQYHVRFPGHTLQVPESLLQSFDETKD